MLALVYGLFVAAFLASPAPWYAVRITLVAFLAFGVPVWYAGYRYGAFRAERRRTPAEGSSSGRQSWSREGRA